jgi:hypothetical protein
MLLRKKRGGRVKKKNRGKSKAWEKAVEALHASVGAEADTGRRMQTLAAALTGRPYVSHPLVGSASEDEQLVVGLSAFDCVTWVESILALARSRSNKGFVAELRRIRYREGRVTWSSRLHYFSDWMGHNHRRGAIKIRTRGAGSRSILVTLGTLAGLPTRSVRIQVVPKHRIRQARRRIGNGSIVAFATVRSRLDFFHTGLLFGAPGEEITLCHASRSKGRVVAEPLDRYLKRNRMRGIAFATPLGRGGYK